MSAEPPVDFMAPVFVELRAKAASKPSTYKPTSRIWLGERRLCEAVQADGRFDAVVATLRAPWSEVFRDLLRARARGVVELVGEDRWAVRP